jgi:hypothetical protein
MSTHMLDIVQMEGSLDWKDLIQVIQMVEDHDSMLLLGLGFITLFYSKIVK